MDFFFFLRHDIKEIYYCLIVCRIRKWDNLFRKVINNDRIVKLVCRGHNIINIF